MEPERSFENNEHQTATTTVPLPDALKSYVPQQLVGRQIGERYRILSMCGEGSMAFVYKAFDTRLSTDVIVKIPKPEKIADPEFRRRFGQERQLLVQLSHPHVVRIIDMGEHETLPFVVMQYLAGGDLQQRLRDMQARGGQMSPKSLKQWILEIGRALDFVARQGMAHRDVKPANILFDDDNNAFLSDFGLAKVVYGDHRDTDAEMTGAGYIVGTPNYVAPEIVLGNSFDGRADQYALALTVFHLMAGASPMQGASSTATIVNQTQRILPLLNTVRPDVPIGVALAVQQALQKRPAMRFPSSADFAEAVIAGLSAGSESSSSVHQAAQSRVTRNRHPDHRKSDQSRRSSSSTVSSRQSQTDRVSVGKRGLVKCPHCQVPLPLRPIHSGRRGRCIHCHAALKISKDLNKLWLLSSNSEGSGKNSGRSNKSQELIIGEEVFGWKLSKKSAAFMAAGLLIMTLIATVYLTVFVTKESEADRLEQKVNALRATED